MTTELEKQFFDTFGIERKRNQEVTLEAISGGVRSANLSQKPFYEYPQITDYKLLQLLALCQNKSYEEFKSESFKKIIMIMGNNPYHKHRVQAIFEEER